MTKPVVIEYKASEQRKFKRLASLVTYDELAAINMKVFNAYLCQGIKKRVPRVSWRKKGSSPKRMEISCAIGIYVKYRQYNETINKKGLLAFYSVYCLQKDVYILLITNLKLAI